MIIFDEQMYASVTDELNDHDASMTLDDLDEDAVAAAKQFAEENNFPWPPKVGDFDRYYEWHTNGRVRR